MIGILFTDVFPVPRTVLSILVNFFSILFCLNEKQTKIIHSNPLTILIIHYLRSKVKDSSIQKYLPLRLTTNSMLKWNSVVSFSSENLR